MQYVSGKRRTHTNGTRKIEAYKAEAIALRALMYCNLTSVFRDVPYLTKPLTLSEAQAPKTERSQIISSLLEDLKIWIPKIPVIGKAQTGRLTQEAAYAIMGRIALSTSIGTRL